MGKTHRLPVGKDPPKLPPNISLANRHETRSITKEEFERAYCQLRGLTTDDLINLGREAFPCHCDYERCGGWQMVNARDHLENELFYLGLGRVVLSDSSCPFCGDTVAKNEIHMKSKTCCVIIRNIGHE